MSIVDGHISHLTIVNSARITSTRSADRLWFQKDHSQLVSWMVKLTGKPAYTKRADSGSVLWSEEDHPGPSVHGAQRSVWRDFFASSGALGWLTPKSPTGLGLLSPPPTPASSPTSAEGKLLSDSESVTTSTIFGSSTDWWTYGMCTLGIDAHDGWSPESMDYSDKHLLNTSTNFSIQDIQE